MTEPAKALLLDLDGTLVVTDELHFQATMLVLPEFDLSMDRATYMAEIHGGANDDIKRFLFEDRAETRGAEYVAWKEARFRGLLEDVPTVPGALDLLDRARTSGLKLAVVTNAPRPNAELLLVPFGGEKAFDAVILGDELEHGKPNPLPYLTALSLLGVDARNACGFEDSISGVTALVRAGVNAIGIGEGPYADDLVKAGARHVVPNMAWDGLANITEVRELFTRIPLS